MARKGKKQKATEGREDSLQERNDLRNKILALERRLATINSREVIVSINRQK